MKLTDTAQFQQDSGKMFGEPSISFNFRVRDEENSELIQKDFTFSYAKHFDVWTLQHYVEKRRDENSLNSSWRTVEDIHWDKAHLSDVDIDIPQYVIDKLDEMLETDIIKIQI